MRLIIEDKEFYEFGLACKLNKKEALHRVLSEFPDLDKHQPEIFSNKALNDESELALILVGFNVGQSDIILIYDNKNILEEDLKELKLHGYIDTAKAQLAAWVEKA